MIVDAHQHFWQVGENGFEWPTPDLAPIHRDFVVDDWLAEAAATGVTHSIAVQSQPSDADTDWLLDVAEAAPSVLGVVGWADFEAPDAAARIAALASRPKLLGFRPMLQSLPIDWIAKCEIRPALDAMEEHDLAFDALIFARHAPALVEVLKTRPNLRVVVDHGAKPPIAAGGSDEWYWAIARLSELPNVHCKISGLLTEAEPGAIDLELRSYVAHLVECFGVDRLMWGSDWPALLLAGSYREWLEMADRLTGFSPVDRDALFAGNARRFYRC